MSEVNEASNVLGGDGSGDGASGGAGSPSNGAANPDSAGQGGSAGGASEAGVSWMAEFDEGTQSFVQNKAWDNPADVVKAYRDLEGLRGVPADRLVKLPDPDSGKPEDWNEVYTKLGRPESPDGYEVKLPDGVSVDETRLSGFKEHAHKLGLTPAQVAGLAAWDAEYGQGAMAAQTEAHQTRAQQDLVDLRKELGAGFDLALQRCDAAAAEFGIDTEAVEKLDMALGRSVTIKFLSEIGRRVGEDSFEDGGDRGGDKGFSVMTPAQADAKISELKRDEGFMKRYMKGEKDATAHMDQLYRLKVGGE